MASRINLVAAARMATSTKYLINTAPRFTAILVPIQAPVMFPTANTRPNFLVFVTSFQMTF